MGTIPDDYRELFDLKTFAHFSTVMPDGTPHVTPVWVDYDEDADRLLVNTARGRRKERNVGENPKVGLSVIHPEDPYTFLSVRGEVTDRREEGAVDHINELARRYMDVEEYPNLGDEEGARVVIEIRPDEVSAGQ